MKNKKIIFLFLILLVITAYEISILTDISLWHDEAFSGLLPQYNLKEMLYRIGLDVHPPLYYLLLKGWVMILGNTLFTLRLFSVFFGILTVIVIYLFLKEAFKNQKLALFSSILLAFNSFFIQFAIESRMFTLGIFLVVLSIFFLLKALKNKKWSWWLLYALSVSAGLYTHYYIFFSILAQGLFLVFWLFKEAKFNLANWLKNRNFQLGLTSYILVVISYLPWLKIFLSQMRQVQEGYWISPINLWSIPATFFKMTTGGDIGALRFWYVLIALMAVVIAAIIYALKKIKTPTKWLIFLMLIIPFLGAVAFSFKTSIYLDRYFIFALPFYLILMGGAILVIKNKWIRNALIVVTILGSLIAFPIRWLNLNVEKKPGMAEAAAYLNQQVKPGNKIYVGSSFIYFTFKYYNKTGVYPLLYAPGTLSHFSGTALLSPEDLIKDFNQEVKRGEIVWLINTTGFGNYQPAVPGNWLKLTEKGFQDVYDYRGWIIVTTYQVQ
ncbi:glycosyltransferase family 39 protein [Patescibacteria group bacterium]|nr:glycosyltransferase family 39 protein [Patescibacteria group bacterium]MBU4481421.1 glycosyltransferase family 39 protein [Patescibacteria group bacterium]